MAKNKTDWQPALFETENPLYNADKSRIKGKIFTLERTEDGNTGDATVSSASSWRGYLERGRPRPHPTPTEYTASPKWMQTT